MDVTGSVSHFLNYFNIFKGLTPGGKNKGFMSGLLSGISIFSGLIKSNKANKEKTKNETEANASKGEE